MRERAKKNARILALGLAFAAGTGGVVRGADDTASANCWLPDAVWMRGGFSATSPSQNFREYRVGADWAVPLSAGWTGNWRVTPRVEFSTGSLWRVGGDTAFITSLGPGVSVGYGDFPVQLEVACCPTFVSRHVFGDADFGCDFQFTSYLGFIWEINRHVVVGYRFQHMSNAGISDINPGLELHVLSVAWRF